MNQFKVGDMAVVGNIEIKKLNVSLWNMKSNNK